MFLTDIRVGFLLYINDHSDSLVCGVVAKLHADDRKLADKERMQQLILFVNGTC